MSSPSLSLEDLKAQLQHLRRGQALGHPSSVLALNHDVRRALRGAQPMEAGTADEVTLLLDVLSRAVDGLHEHERVYARVDLNLDPEHRFPTLTERQESLAHLLGCAAKTVRRRADRVLESLAVGLLTPPVPRQSDRRTNRAPARPETVANGQWRDRLRDFWRMPHGTRVDLVCSEIPDEELPYYANPADRNYLRYAKFADLDGFVYVRTRLAQVGPDVHMRDFTPSEYHDTEFDTLVVIGGPPWNAQYRRFLPQLPYYFAPHPLGEDDPLVVPQLDELTIGPRWTRQGELLEDLAVFTRLTLAGTTTVFLLAGCLTLGVLGAARCFLQAEHGAGNADYITDLVGDDDFVLVTEARRIGAIIDVIDLAVVPPLLVFARRNNDPFTVMVNNVDRHPRL
ncbi:MAG TPA: hypothetical protein VEO01_23175 [Pseudonocardiaceae bacterium]|nr:hypothetical protein [Pseudonocardiaceae bacterium]